MNRNKYILKTKMLSVLLIVAILISPALLSPFKVSALEQKMPAISSFWPGGLSGSLGDTDSITSSNYTAVSITAEEYPDTMDMQILDIDMLGMDYIQMGSLLKIIQIPESNGMNPEDYNLTLHLSREGDGIDITLPTLNYYLPVRQTLTASDGRTCEIFIIAIPEIRNYSEEKSVEDYISAGILFVDKYLEINELYWDMMDSHDFPAVLGGPHPASRRALMALSFGIKPYIVPRNSEGGSFPFGSEMSPAITAQWLHKQGYFSPAQAYAIFDTVFSYYIEYAKMTIPSPELLGIEAQGSLGIKQEDGSYILYYPNGLNVGKLQKTAKYITEDPSMVYIKSSGAWKVGGISAVSLYARDPATVHVYNNESDGIIEAKALIRIENGVPLFILKSFCAYRRIGSVDQTANRVYIHIPDDESLVFRPDIDFVGSDAKYYDNVGTEVYPDENGCIDFTVAKTIVIVNDFSDYMADSGSDPIVFTKEYTLEVTQGNSSECDMLNYTLGIEDEIVEWNGNTITVHIPYGTDWSSLNSQFAVSYDATVRILNEEDYINSGSDPIVYRVTAQNGIDYKDYYVSVMEKPASDENYITSFRYGSISAVIDNDNNKISMELPAGSSMSFAPSIEVSKYAILEPMSGVIQDFSKEMIYIVRSQSGIIREYTVSITVSTQPVDNPRKGDLWKLLNAIISKYRGGADDDWEWLNLGVYEKLIENNGDQFDIAKQISDLDVGENAVITDVDRLIMMLTARGYDCTNLAKYNDGQPFIDKAGNKVDNLVANLYGRGISSDRAFVNCRIFALIALDMGNYAIPDNAKLSRDYLINSLVNHEYLSDGWGIDMVGMLMYAIAPYQDDSIYGVRVKAKLDEGVALIIKKMKADYCFESWGSRNSEASSQVIAALTSCGIDCYLDPRFSSEAGSVLSSWIDVFSVTNGFMHTSGGGWNSIATYEGCYALQWYLGFLENGGAGHPYYLYYHLFDFSSELSTDADILSFSIDGKEGVITEGGENGNNTITIELPKGMPLTNITPDIVLSDKATLIAPSLPVTFVKGVEQAFTVLAEDGKTAKTYFVTVTTSDVLPSGSKLDPDSIVLETGSQKEIEILNRKVTQTTSGTDILLTVAPGVDTSNLRLIADISYGAVSNPAVDGSISLDLSDWTAFTVVSADSANTSVYRIKVQQKGKASIESFSLTIQGRVYAGVIDHDALTITVCGVDDSSLSSTVFAPDIELGEDTIVCSPLPGIEQDFSVPVVYTVAGNDIESCSYTVRVTTLKGELIKASGGGSGGGGNNHVDYTEITNRLWRLVTENNTIVDHQISYGRRLI